MWKISQFVVICKCFCSLCVKWNSNYKIMSNIVSILLWCLVCSGISMFWNLCWSIPFPTFHFCPFSFPSISSHFQIFLPSSFHVLSWPFLPIPNFYRVVLPSFLKGPWYRLRLPSWIFGGLDHVPTLWIQLCWCGCEIWCKVNRLNVVYSLNIRINADDKTVVVTQIS